MSLLTSLVEKFESDQAELEKLRAFVARLRERVIPLTQARPNEDMVDAIHRALTAPSPKPEALTDVAK